ncbi:MAG: hypothetical protein PHF46_04340 [Candidatus Gracilibacteria bacterium]|nr:hypothetical protein [Candidatus Gracilibacteria bacterium]
MAGIKYTGVQMEELKKNKYVKNVTNKNITFNLECKLEVVKLSKKGMFYRDIFKKLGFPEYIIKSKIPERSYNRWKTKNKNGNIEDKKGRPKKEKIDFNNMTLEQENEYLRAKLALYEELADYMKSGLP